MRPALLALLLCLLAARGGECALRAPRRCRSRWSPGRSSTRSWTATPRMSAGRFPSIGSALRTAVVPARRRVGLALTFTDITVGCAGSRMRTSSVSALAADGAGGFYVGGEFDRVLGRAPRRARAPAGGRVDRSGVHGAGARVRVRAGAARRTCCTSAAAFDVDRRRRRGTRWRRWTRARARCWTGARRSRARSRTSASAATGCSSAGRFGARRRRGARAGGRAGSRDGHG